MESSSNSSTVDDSLILYQAIKENRIRDIKFLLKYRAKKSLFLARRSRTPKESTQRKKRNKYRAIINDPVLTTGPLAGYTALHLACMENSANLVEFLVKHCKADVNVVADDGTQPIHLVCLFDRSENSDYVLIKKMNVLLEANANINAEIGREMFVKHVKDQDWCPDFGDKISLITFAIIYQNNFLTEYLSGQAALSVRTISRTNKTLPMYAIERDYCDIASFMIRFDDPDLVNHRDDDGVPVTHYLLDPKKFGGFRYDSKENGHARGMDRGFAIMSFLEAGADKYALINNDPSTFLVNMAAYRSCSNMLWYLLPEYTHMSLSKALYYATLPVDENSENYLRINDVHVDHQNTEQFREMIRQQRTDCTQLILQDLINRRTFGLPVPKDEIKLMDELVNSDEDVRTFVNSYLNDFINGKLKRDCIELSDKIMSLYDFLLQAFDDKKIKLLVRDEDLMKKYNYFLVGYRETNYCYFKCMISKRIKFFRRQSELLKKLEKISTLREAVPLPYELILYIVEFLNNDDLENFINAFEEI